MNNFLIALLLVALPCLLGGCGASGQVSDANSGTSSPNYSSSEWWNGGTLHSASVGEWKNSTEENKLATSGDFVSGTIDTSQVKSMDEILVKAQAVRACINKATDGTSQLDSHHVSEIAALCLISLGYKK
jgi:hypothetical protein